LQSASEFGEDKPLIAQQDCVALDDQDPLAGEAVKYYLPEGVLYFAGNSLGALPKAAQDRVTAIIRDEWGEKLVDSWNSAGWYVSPARVGAKIAQLVGADADEVTVSDSTSVNLFKSIIAAMGLNSSRKVCLTDREIFPTDLYIMQGIEELLDERFTLKAVKRENIVDEICDDTALLVLSHIDYRSGDLFDMQKITQHVHEAGGLVLWDLCHSVGIFDIRLNEVDADFAVGCGYKFLNGGPGAPSFVYVAKRHQEYIRQPLSGWMGHANPFAFDEAYESAPGIRRMLCGTPSVIAMGCLEAALDELLPVSIQAIQEKSRKLTRLFIELMKSHCADFGFTLISSENDEIRGSQISYTHEHGYAIMQALIANNVIGDFRAPDCVRFGVSPLYLSYVDIWRAVDTIKIVMETEVWREYLDQRKGSVT
jgi:kynureninase